MAKVAVVDDDFAAKPFHADNGTTIVLWVKMPAGQGHRRHNDAAEMTFSVKTAARTLTLEFEAWQGLRKIKVPFKVKAGLGLH